MSIVEIYITFMTKNILSSKLPKFSTLVINLSENIVALMLIIIMLIQTSSSINKNTEVMKSLSYSFGMSLLKCGDLVNATQPMEKDVYNFWDMNYNLTHISTGCLLLCSMAKLELLYSEGKLNRANAEGYLRANGADDAVVSILFGLYDKCRQLPSSITQPCLVILEVFKCFRKGIHELQWTPDVASLITFND